MEKESIMLGLNEKIKSSYQAEILKFLDETFDELRKFAATKLTEIATYGQGLVLAIICAIFAKFKNVILWLRGKPMEKRDEATQTYETTPDLSPQPRPAISQGRMPCQELTLNGEHNAMPQN